VIFECGLASSSQSWAYIQTSLAAEASTLSYDRAGMGWSSSPTAPPTPTRLAGDLRRILERAGVAPPWLLVAHSFGALVARRAAVDYPQDLAGLVLIDPLLMGQWRRWNPGRSSLLNRGIRLMQAMAPAAACGIIRLVARSLMKHAGVLPPVFARLVGENGRRMIERTTGELRKMPPSVWPAVVSHWSSPGFYRGVIAHLRALPAAMAELEWVRPIENLPVLVLVPAGNGALSGESLARIAPDAEQWVVEDCGHWIHLDRPDVVLDAIRAVLAQNQHSLHQEVRSCQ